MGEVTADRALRRSGAQDNDDIWVSGTPGYAALGLRAKLDSVALPADVSAKAYAALHRPQPRVALGLTLRDLAHSAIDVSDGLLQDLGHIARASGLCATLNETWLPTAPVGVDAALWQGCLLGGGDDYELLFTAPATVRDVITTLSQKLDLPLTRIGSIHAGRASAEAGTMNADPVQVLDAAQQPIDLSRHCAGFDHFAS
jgi:thiamine-monophosphate kinase